MVGLCAGAAIDRARQVPSRVHCAHRDNRFRPIPRTGSIRDGSDTPCGGPGDRHARRSRTERPGRGATVSPRCNTVGPTVAPGPNRRGGALATPWAGARTGQHTASEPQRAAGTGLDPELVPGDGRPVTAPVRTASAASGSTLRQSAIPCQAVPGAGRTASGGSIPDRYFKPPGGMFGAQKLVETDDQDDAPVPRHGRHPRQGGVQGQHEDWPPTFIVVHVPHTGMRARVPAGRWGSPDHGSVGPGGHVASRLG